MSGKPPLKLILSKAYEASGQNAENNEIVKMAEEFIEKNPTMGDEDAVSLTYSGLGYTQNDQFYSVFLLTNRTGKSLSNFSFDVTWAYDRQVILNNQGINYKEDKMNYLPNNSTILFFIPIPKLREEIVRSIKDFNQFDLRIHNIQIMK